MHGLTDALLGTLFTWFLTAVGAACVLIVPQNRRDILDTSLGFSGGVMLAASYWSLLAPALDMAETQGWGSAACVPVALGLIGGAVFVLGADLCLPDDILGMMTTETVESDDKIRDEQVTNHTCNGNTDSGLRHRNVTKQGIKTPNQNESPIPTTTNNKLQIRRLILLVIAITVHNFPEGLAVGVGYASVGPDVDIQQAHNLALGIGLQNFPEGLAVSVPLKAAGYSTLSSFFWGQASGMVEPLAGVLGVLCVSLAERLLPAALAFAAGAMIWVVGNDIIPECAANGNTRLCSVGLMAGFVVMMTLDTALG